MDVDYIYAAAKWDKQSVGARRFALASSSSAKESSLSFYLRAKEQVERCASELGFEDFQIAHLPLILGEKPDARLLERLAAAVFKLLPACVLGKFRPLSGASIARAMIKRLAATRTACKSMSRGNFYKSRVEF